MDAVGRLLGKVHGPVVGTHARAMMESWPGLSWKGCFFVEDSGAKDSSEAPARAVSTLQLIPRTWSLEGVPIEMAQMGFVATDPDYRNRGLVAALSKRFDEAAAADGYALAGLLGIPYFYSQFGYDYAAPLGTRVSLAAAEVPGTIDEDPLRDRTREFEVRPAVEADIPDLASLWDAWGRRFDLRCLRDEPIWRSVIGRLQDAVRGRDCVVAERGRVVGLFGAHFSEKRAGMFGVVTPERDVTLAAVRWAAEQTLEKGAPRLSVAAAGTPVHETVLGLGGRQETPYAWQMKVYDHRALLERLRPVLEKRLAGSPLRGLTHELLIDLYRLKLTLKWTGGRLEDISVNPVPGPVEAQRVRMPPGAFVQLLTGSATFGRLRRERLDVTSPGPYAELMDVLFPRLEIWAEEL